MTLHPRPVRIGTAAALAASRRHRRRLAAKPELAATDATRWRILRVMWAATRLERVDQVGKALGYAARHLASEAQCQGPLGRAKALRALCDAERILRGDLPRS